MMIPAPRFAPFDHRPLLIMHLRPRLAPLALALLAPVAIALPGEEGEVPAADWAWLQLDDQVESWAESALPEGTTVDVNVLLRAFYTFSEDAVLDATEDRPRDRLDFIDAELAVDVARGHWRARASFDKAEGSGDLEDAWLQWAGTPRFLVRAGKIKPRITWSNSVDPELLLFQDRTYIGALFDLWDAGLELSGNYDQFDWYLSMVDGEDGFGADDLYVGRIEWAHYDAAWTPQEGARGAPNHLRVMLGATGFKESGSFGPEEASGLGADMLLTLGPYALHHEFLWLGGGSNGITKGAGVPGIAFREGSNPWDVTFSRMFGAEWQSGVRFQSPDDQNDTTAWGFSIHRYLRRFPASLAAEWVTHDADPAGDGWFFRLGFNLGRSRS